MTNRAFGVPPARGPLRTYRDCEYCEGLGNDPMFDLPCIPCGGRGEILVSEISQSAANRQAAEVVRGTQGRGRAGRSM